MKKKRYLALLRGINVGGHKKLLMADLKSLFETIGFTDVKTYIQSGNVVFSSEKNTELNALISEAIQSKYGWEVPVLVRTAAEIKAILNDCPFPQDKKEKSYFMLLYQTPSSENINRTREFQFPDEEYAISPDCVYFFCSIGYGRAKMGSNFFENKLKVTVTSRNYNTLIKLLEMLG